MAKNKRPQDRHEKHDEIVAVARTLFLDEGYEATSMSRLAAGAGVTPNTIYWYFKDKDEVLVAVLNDVVSTQWQAYLAAPMPRLADKLLWLLESLETASQLVTTVHARILAAPAINDWHDNFHRMGEALFRHELLTHGVPEADVDAQVKIMIFTIEGLLVHGLGPETNRRVCEALVARL